jgi:hypothetical protein
MELTIRQLNENDYQDILVDWWKQWGWTAPEKDFLPDDGMGGYIVYDEEIPICAGFIYVTNSRVAWVDWIISNKEYRGKRKEAITMLIDTLTNLSKMSGSKYVFSNNNNRFLINYFIESGYIVGCKNSVELIKKF